MKILYDLIYLEKERHGGISNVWYQYFQKICQNENEINFLSKKNIDNVVYRKLCKVNFFDRDVIKLRSSPFTVLDKFLSLNIVRGITLSFRIKSDVDIFHSTGFSNPFFRRKKLKIVSTIHDMVLWDQKAKMKKSISYWDYYFGTYHAIKTSDLIITISDTSKASIIKQFPSVKNKVKVIYNGLSEDFLNTRIRERKDPFFLFIGARNEYKNFNLLIESFAEFSEINSSYKLFIIGDNQNSYNKEKELYKLFKIEDKVFDLGILDTKNLINILTKAKCLIIPSLNEGFNLPLVEGLASGCPVAALDIPINKEIGLDYVFFFKNYKSSLVDIMFEVSDKVFTMDELSDAKLYCEKFDWEESSSNLLKEYKKLISN